MYYIVKMSSGWFAKKISDVASYEQDIQELVDNGDVVSLADDLETFADAVSIDIDDIKIV